MGSLKQLSKAAQHRPPGGQSESLLADDQLRPGTAANRGDLQAQKTHLNDHPVGNREVMFDWPVSREISGNESRFIWAECPQG
jgi:hypothetical protein